MSFRTKPARVKRPAPAKRRSGDLFAWIADDRLDVRIGERIPMAEAKRAHEILEGRKTTGKVVLVP